MNTKTHSHGRKYLAYGVAGFLALGIATSSAAVFNVGSDDYSASLWQVAQEGGQPMPPPAGGMQPPSGGMQPPAGGMQPPSGGMQQPGGSFGGQQGGSFGGQQPSSGVQSQGGSFSGQQGGQMGGSQFGGQGQTGGQFGSQSGSSFGGQQGFGASPEGMKSGSQGGQSGMTKPGSQGGQTFGQPSKGGQQGGQGQFGAGSFPGQGKGVEGEFPGQGKGVEGGFPGGKGEGSQKGFSPTKGFSPKSFGGGEGDVGNEFGESEFSAPTSKFAPKTPSTKSFSQPKFGGEEDGEFGSFGGDGTGTGSKFSAPKTFGGKEGSAMKKPAGSGFFEFNTTNSMFTPPKTNVKKKDIVVPAFDEEDEDYGAQFGDLVQAGKKLAKQKSKSKYLSNVYVLAQTAEELCSAAEIDCQDEFDVLIETLEDSGMKLKELKSVVAETLKALAEKYADETSSVEDEE